MAIRTIAGPRKAGGARRNRWTARTQTLYSASKEALDRKKLLQRFELFLSPSLVFFSIYLWII
jgi:hypothetical protein